MAHKEEIKTEAQLLEFCTHMCDELIRGVVYGDEIENENLLKYNDSTLHLDAKHPWASRLINCLELHYQCTSRWRKLIDDSREADKDILNKLHEIQKKALHARVAATIEELEEWNGIIEGITTVHQETVDKVQSLYQEALETPCLRKRLAAVEKPERVVPIYSIKNKDLMLKRGEELQLIDNSDRVIWKVKREDTGKIYTAPSILLVLPGPDDRAEEEVQELHTKLNDALFRTTKIATESLVSFLTTHLTNVKEEKREILQSSDNGLKESLQGTLSTLEGVANSHLTNVDGQEELLGAIRSLMVRASMGSGDGTADRTASQEMRDEFSVLSNIMEQYKSMVDDLKKTNNNLEYDPQGGLQVLRMNVGPKSDEGTRIRRFWEVTYITKEIQRVEEVTYIPESPMTPSSAGSVEYSDFSFGEQSETAESEQITNQSGEERRRFFIEGVIDPRNGEVISMKDACQYGILDQGNGEYVDISTGERCPIPEAMNDGRIVVTFQTATKKEDRAHSLGLVTIRHKHPTKSKKYHVSCVVHPVTGKMLQKDEALAQHILDETCSIYKNPKSGNEMLISEAVNRKLVFADVDAESGDEEDEEPQETSKSYIINAVVDRRLKRRISFKQATLIGLIDRASGAYNDNVTGEKMYVGEAIKRGFLKAKEIDNPKSMDIDPDNHVVIEKVEHIRQKLLRPIKVIRAFQAMRMAGKLKGKNSEIKENGSTTIPEEQE
ncbi:uncharacterized protein LOC135494697 isoform X2 [Lineus longissimus]